MPGERHPSRHDVETASELPEPAFLSDFKRALFASPDAVDRQDLMHLDFRTDVNVPIWAFGMDTTVLI